MEVFPHTKISEIIRENPDSIDVIAALSKPLEKLKNPILRRIMASRVTVAQAVVIGRCSLQDFRDALTNLGFHFVEIAATQDHPTDASPPDHRPDWLAEIMDRKKKNIELFDVRAIIRSGGDPLRDIVQKFKDLPEGHILNVINSFVPYPLIELLEKQGAQSHCESAGDHLHYTFFLKPSAIQRSRPNSSNPGGLKCAMYDEDTFNKIVVAHTQQGQVLRQIDVRDLEMPQPMYAILEELESLTSGQALYVLHKRLPTYLLETLADRNLHIHICDVEDGNTRLLIVANKP